MNAITKHIGKKLAQLREGEKLSQEELSKLMGFKSRISIANMEAGKQSFTEAHIYLFCCIFNVSPTDLFPKVKNSKNVIYNLPNIKS